MDKQSIDPAVFRQVLGNYPTGVAVITAADSTGTPLGMVVGTFTSVSLDPPLVGFLPDKRSSTWPQIEASGRFCVNVFASDQLAQCKQLARSGPDKFEGVSHSRSPHGLPVLDDAMVVIECGLHSVVEAGDHWFVLGAVEAMEVRREADPMLFFRGKYGGFAEIA
jgi:flavin reductase (DIM6/NTAB) family NADH-FMN oxidoreductase RutF